MVWFIELEAYILSGGFILLAGGLLAINAFCLELSWVSTTIGLTLCGYILGILTMCRVFWCELRVWHCVAIAIILVTGGSSASSPTSTVSGITSPTVGISPTGLL